MSFEKLTDIIVCSTLLLLWVKSVVYIAGRLVVVHSLIGVLSVSLQAFSEVGQVLDQTFLINLLVDVLN